jgi:hypothetical protein
MSTGLVGVYGTGSVVYLSKTIKMGVVYLKEGVVSKISEQNPPSTNPNPPLVTDLCFIIEMNSTA